MEVKIQCSCGTRYAFDVEPVHGRMPVRVKCPGCGADGTEFANEVLQQKLNLAVPAPVSATPASRLQKDLPVHEKKRTVVRAKQRRAGMLVWRAAVFLLVAFLAAWIWYIFSGSHPQVVYSEKIPRGDRARFYQFLVPNQVLSIKAGQMSLFDLTEQKQLWSVAFQSKTFAAPLGSASTDAEDDPATYPKPHVIATADDLWILSPGHIRDYDRHTGNSKQEIPLNPPFFGMAQSDAGMTVISSDESGREIVMRIAFPGGAVQTAPVEPATVAPVPSGLSMLPPANVMAPPARGEDRASLGDKFMPDGNDVVQMKTDLIERRTITHQAMKPQKKSLVEDNLTAGQSLEASEQMINDLHRDQTGGVSEEDASRYQVTLRRLPVGAAPDWTGEVIGTPSFFSLKARDVLVAGSTIHVFDKHNKLLWSANLTYAIPPHYSEDFATEADPPCVESGDSLYVFDRGMLTSLDAATGEIHWRLTSVGISQVQPDGMGHLYVTSTTASPDTIQFSQQVSLTSKANPVILKVDAATGKVLWRTEGTGDKCFLSGKFIYASRAAVDPTSMITPGEDPILYFDFYRLSPSDGHMLWDYPQSRHPVQIEVQGNEILLHFRGELQVLKFLSL